MHLSIYDSYASLNLEMLCFFLAGLLYSTIFIAVMPLWTEEYFASYTNSLSLLLLLNYSTYSNETWFITRTSCTYICRCAYSQGFLILKFLWELWLFELRNFPIPNLWLQAVYIMYKYISFDYCISSIEGVIFGDF